MSQTQNDLSGIPIDLGPIRDQDLSTLPSYSPSTLPVLSGLNEAKAAAAANGAKAVMFLAEVFTNDEYDITERVQAAAELLQFLAKGPF